MADVTHGVEDGEPLVTGYAGRMSMLLAFAWSAILLGRQAVSPLLPAIIADLGLSPTRAGFGLTVLMGLYAAAQYPGGRVSDQLSRTTVIAAGTGVMIGGFGLLAFAGGYEEFLAGVAFVGVGAGLFFSPARALLSDLYVERRGQVYGLHAAAGMIGGLLAATSAAAVLAVATWQAAFLAPIVLLAAVLVALVRWSRESFVVERVSLEARATASRLFASWEIPLVILGLALFGFTLQSFIGFLPTLLQAERGFSPTGASLAFALIYVVGLVASPGAGRLSDRIPRRRIVVGSLLTGATGVAVLVAAPSRPAVYVGVVLTAFGLWAYIPSVTAYVMDILPDESLGGDFGLIKSVYTGLGSLGPTYVGAVAERASYSVAFAGLVGCLVLAVIVMFVVTRPD